MTFDVVVVGSINYDITVRTERLPKPGETLIGQGHFFGPGGKGANQAVAAARLGGRVAMVGRVGSDDWGRSLAEGLEAEGIDVSGIGVDDDASTGMAVITIDSEAENTIVGSSGANMKLSPELIARSTKLISGAKVVLAQLEIPIETVELLADLVNGAFILNPAPAQVLSKALLNRVDVLVPNRSELSILSGRSEIREGGEVEEVARSLHPRGTTVVTLGAEGAVLIDRDQMKRFPPFPVEAVDPTGAGDAFCGALAVSLSRGEPMTNAVRFATAAGAIAVETLGAQSGLPSFGDVEALLMV